MKIKHSKYKNTGILFELLVRQITADTLKGSESKAITLLKEYFVKTELGREYKLYESLVKSKVLNEGRANIFISTILENSKKFNRKALKKQKYNLINEIKKHYNLESFFGSKISNYKQIAAIYTLIESYNCKEVTDLDQINSNKITLLEFLTKSEIKKEDKDKVLKEFSSYDKDLRQLTYRVLLEKFNEKYDGLSAEQKEILKEFIYSVDSTPSLREFYNSKVNILKETLSKTSKNIKDKATQIKITEVAKLLVELDKTDKIDNDNLVDLLQYYELVKEIQVANGQI
ncbi:hypothetical protein N9L94_01250 [Robiginitalea sp.]|jgi:hypothetical protein|nr:hypothetical protein [Robiginitalea sp.]|tara:strand:+ start:3874 stop:4734 length:861 start_codon:yes stop_codon:yes gene_type:complete